MDLDLIKNVKNYIMPYIIREINSQVLPRIDYNGGYVENVSFDFNLQSNDSIDFAFDPVKNAMVLSCQNINGQINGRFKQRLLLISATGNFRASFKNGGIGMHVTIPIHN